MIHTFIVQQPVEFKVVFMFFPNIWIFVFSIL